MAKTKNDHALFVRNLRSLMEQQDLNPRSLSLKAGLNPTAVRDILEGRSKFPRYNTIFALADVLGTTPAVLMSDAKITAHAAKAGLGAYDLELLTEIIARLQEAVAEMDKKFSPREMAAMTTTIFRRMEGTEAVKKMASAVQAQVHDLLDYELLRQKRGR